MPHGDPRLSSPAAQRNGPFILAVLRRVLAPRGRALEIASGTGQHVALFAGAMPQWTWQPSDVDPAALRSIAAWIDAAGSTNAAAPISLDVTSFPWSGVEVVDAIFCANLLHIAPWPTCGALLRGAAQHLDPAGRLVTYGPYFVDGEAPAPGNAAFDADLRRRNREWGVRRLSDVRAEAARFGFVLLEAVPMPANNLTLVFARG